MRAAMSSSCATPTTSSWDSSTRRMPERFLDELRERLAKFALELHPDKTRLHRVRAVRRPDRAARGEGKPETFNFLGFTHICGKSRAGRFLLVRQTMARRMRMKLHDVRVELVRRRHLAIPEQGAWLASIVRGYFAYHAVPTNASRIRAFRTQVTNAWHRSLRRRGQRDRTTWARVNLLAKRWLPLARVQHPWPEQRFDVKTRGKSPVR